MVRLRCLKGKYRHSTEHRRSRTLRLAASGTMQFLWSSRSFSTTLAAPLIFERNRRLYHCGPYRNTNHRPRSKRKEATVSYILTRAFLAFCSNRLVNRLDTLQLEVDAKLAHVEQTQLESAAL